MLIQLMTQKIVIYTFPVKKLVIEYFQHAINANFPGFYNSNHTADRFSASRISFMHDFPETRGSQLWFGYFYQ